MCSHSGVILNIRVLTSAPRIKDTTVEKSAMAEHLHHFLIDAYQNFDEWQAGWMKVKLEYGQKAA